MKRNDGKLVDSGQVSEFWPAVQTLNDLGLVEPDDNAAEVIHPYERGGGEPGEQELARIAHEVATQMVTEGQYDWAMEEGFSELVDIAAEPWPRESFESAANCPLSWHQGFIPNEFYVVPCGD